MEQYRYNKQTGVLKWFVGFRGEEYFDGEDWSWREWAEYREVHGEEKEEVLENNKEVINKHDREVIIL